MRVSSRKLVVSDAVVCAEVDDESVLLNVMTGVYYGLDEVGTRIWQLLSEGCGEGGIVDKLFQEYEVEAEQLRSDVSAFLAQMLEKGLIQEADA